MMDPTTLITFLFKTPLEVRTVELVGSWDNFSQPYRMHHDRRRGNGIWTGCFQFLNVVFDGDSFHWGKPRNGGLKQGGTYWYYYRLNDEAEVYDDLQEYTANCPLLPGQMVNVIQVPMEIVEPPSRCQSACMHDMDTLSSLQSLHTLNPRDKFTAPHPPPISKVHHRCISDLALSGRLETIAHSLPNPSIPPISPPYSAARDDRSVCNASHDRHASCREGTRSARSSVDSRPSSISSARSLAHSSVPDLASHLENDPVSSFTLPDIGPVEELRPLATNEATDHHDLGHEDLFVPSGHLVPAHQFKYTPHIVNPFEPHLMSQAEPAETSRPSTSYGAADPWREIRYSKPSTDCQDHHIQFPKPSPETLPCKPHYSINVRSNSRPFTSSSRYSQPCADQADPNASISSPTFSIATLSSNGELNTPFRLSVGHSHVGAAQTSPDDDGSGEPFSDTLESLHSRFTDQITISNEDSVTSTFNSNQHSYDGPTSFAGYSLPQAAEESLQSLAKLSSAHSSIGCRDRHLTALPPMMTSRTVSASVQESSLTDDIFSELAYLSASIS